MTVPCSVAGEETIEDFITIDFRDGRAKLVDVRHSFLSYFVKAGKAQKTFGCSAFKMNLLRKSYAFTLLAKQKQDEGQQAFISCLRTKDVKAGK